MYLSIELLGAGVFRNNGDAGISTDIKGFSNTGRDGYLSFYPSLCNDFTIEKYLHVTAFPGAAAVVLECKPYSVVTWR